MSNLLTVVAAAKEFDVNRKVIEAAIAFAKIEPTHMFPSGKGMAGLYEPELVKKALADHDKALKDEAKKAEAQAKQAKQPGSIGLEQFTALEGKLDNIVTRIEEVGKTMVDMQVTEEEAGQEARTLAEQNRLTFKAVTDLSNATLSAFKELNALMIGQVNRLSEITVTVEAHVAEFKAQQAKTGADTHQILELLRAVAAVETHAPAANSPLTDATSKAPAPREIEPPPPVAPAKVEAPAPAPAPTRAVRVVKAAASAPALAPVKSAPLSVIETNLGATNTVTTPGAQKVSVEAVNNSITEAFSSAGVTKSKVVKGPKPVIVVAGLVGVQQEEIRREFGDQITFEMFEGDETIGSKFAGRCSKATWIFVLQKVMNNPLKNALQTCKGKFTTVVGHTSAVKMEITKWLADRAAQTIAA